VPATLLIVDGVATNRIHLKSRLSAACYDVHQVDRISALKSSLRQVRPDLILSAGTLPDGNAAQLRAALRTNEQTAGIPVIALAAQDDPGARLAALASGVDDVLSRPLDEGYLLARIRSLLRRRQSESEWQPREADSRALGFGEPRVAFRQASHITLICADRVAARRRARTLRERTEDRVTAYPLDALNDVLTQAKAPDAIVLDLTDDVGRAGLSVLAELKSRPPTRRAALIAVCPEDAPALAADALDMGADDVLPTGFAIDELALRLAAQLRRKRRADRMRATVRRGLRAAITDPMTGLYNRRYAMPYLERVARRAAGTGRGFAVMLADLDHFKSVNDRFGHAAGDTVLVETAQRLQCGLGRDDLLARVGGEEFLIVLADTTPADAQQRAGGLCARLCAAPVEIGRGGPPLHVTISIGLVCGPVPLPPGTEDLSSHLLQLADQALYVAKKTGRNQVTRHIEAA
jgi:two-component system cell cycle response regulator